jgi:hypothetical protein
MGDVSNTNGEQQLFQLKLGNLISNLKWTVAVSVQDSVSEQRRSGFT